MYFLFNKSLSTNLTTMSFAIWLQEEFTTSWLNWVNNQERLNQILIGQVTSNPTMMEQHMPMNFTTASMHLTYLISFMQLTSVSLLIGLLVQTKETIRELCSIIIKWLHTKAPIKLILWIWPLLALPHGLWQLKLDIPIIGFEQIIKD